MCFYRTRFSIQGLFKTTPCPPKRQRENHTGVLAPDISHEYTVDRRSSEQLAPIFPVEEFFEKSFVYLIVLTVLFYVKHFIFCGMFPMSYISVHWWMEFSIVGIRCGLTWNATAQKIENFACLRNYPQFCLAFLQIAAFVFLIW